MLIDTHAHIIPAFFDNPDNEIQKIIDAGVGKVINIGTNITECEQALEICKQYPNLLFPALGLHPEIAYEKNRDAITNDLNTLEHLYLAHKEIVVAIGECGLEYKEIPEDREEEIKENQEYMFRKQLDLSIAQNMPIIIHCRFAMEQLNDILKTYKTPIKGVLHSVDGSLETIQQLINMGLYVSFNGIMTFKNAQHINELVDTIDIDHIVLETDAPFLAPVPLRGTKNTPANMKYIYEYIAERKHIPLHTVEKTIEKNVKNLFGLF